MDKLISVVVTYNSSGWLDRCFPPLLASSRNAHTIVVDNASADSTVAELHERYPAVEVMAQPSNLGFGAANNLGIRRALALGATHCLLINHDAWPLDDAIEVLVETANAHPEAGIVSALHVLVDGRTLDRPFADYLLQAGVRATRADDVAATDPFAVPFVNAAGWLLPRATFERVGGFSPLFFHYGEDRDYAARVHYHGLRILVEPAARMVHARDARPFGWREDGAIQLRSMRTGLRYRLADPTRNGWSQIATAGRWWLGNLVGLVKAGQWRYLLPALGTLDELKALGGEVATHRKAVRTVGGSFLDLPNRR